jgi:hypothetical protein
MKRMAESRRRLIKNASANDKQGILIDTLLYSILSEMLPSIQTGKRKRAAIVLLAASNKDLMKLYHRKHYYYYNQHICRYKYTPLEKRKEN